MVASQASVEQWGSQVRKALEKFAVIIGEADKAPHVGAGHRTGPGPDGINLAGVHGHATSRNDVAKEADRGPAELALAGLSVELVVA